MSGEVNFDWIKKEDDEQLVWLQGYIQRAFVIPLGRRGVLSKDSLIETIKRHKFGDALELFNLKARNSWSQRQRRGKLKRTHVATSVELTKELHANVVSVAKQENIPINLAIEELLKIACDVVKQANIEVAKKKESKRVAQKSLKKIKAYEGFAVNERLSSKLLEKHLGEEMYHRHQLEIVLINKLGETNLIDEVQLSIEIKKEKSRYLADCKKLKIEPVFPSDLIDE